MFPMEGVMKNIYLILKYSGVVLMPLYYTIILMAYSQTVILPEFIFPFVCLISVVCFSVGVFLERPYVNSLNPESIAINKWVNIFGSIVLVLFSLVAIWGFQI